MAIQKKVYMLLGGLVGPDGALLAPVENSGMLVIQGELRIMGCELHVDTWDQWAKFVPLIGPASPAYKNIVIGYSGGGWRATTLANSTRARIDLLILIDPSPKWKMESVSSNVVRSLLIHNSEMMGSLGGGELSATGPIERVEVRAPHLLVPELPEVLKKVIETVRAL
jgi:pimeloyl-ACP methyl ester carboxylesterase